MNKYLLRVATDYGSVEKHSRKPVEGLRFRWCIAIAPNDILVCRLSEIPSGIIPWSTLEAIPHVLESDFGKTLYREVFGGDVCLANAFRFIDVAVVQKVLAIYKLAIPEQFITTIARCPGMPFLPVHFDAMRIVRHDLFVINDPVFVVHAIPLHQ